MSRDCAFLRGRVIAHRGCFNFDVPENSMGAIQRACEKNYIIELDVHLTLDNEIVVFHDNNLKRLTGLDKEIRFCTKRELEKIYLNKTKYTIPTLRKVLEFVNGKVPLLIEVKDDSKVGKLERKLGELLDHYHGEFAIQSFRLSTIFWFRIYRPHYIRGFIVSSSSLWFRKSFWKSRLLQRGLGLDFFSCYYRFGCYKEVCQLRECVLLIGWTIRTLENYVQYKDCFDNIVCENIENLLR